MGVLVGLIVVVALIVFWIIGVQRQLVVLDENVNNAMSQIGVNQSSRFDALTGLLDLVKGYNEHEYKTLTDVVRMRTSVGGSTSAKVADEQESIISQVAGKIMAVAEAYPDLKSNTNYQNLMNSLNDYENKVRSARLIYNDTVTKLNRQIRMFPINMVAPIVGVSSRDYLKTEEAKTEMPSMK